MIGQVLRYRYELERRLGEGAAFLTFVARDRIKNRSVVIKVLRPSLNTNPAIRMALKEYAEAPRDWAGTGLTSVLGVDDHEGHLFLITELAAGMPLSERIRRTAPFSVPVAVDTAIGIAQALDPAHRLGKAHGALQPTDIIVGVDGGVKITDFGLRDVFLAETEVYAALTASHAPYEAPEAEGGPTPESDVYALGVILFEMLTGERPLVATGAARGLVDPGAAPLPSMRTLNPGVPKMMEELVDKATARSPAGRYRNAGEMLLDLKAMRDSLRFGKALDWSLKPSGVPPPVTAPAVETRLKVEATPVAVVAPPPSKPTPQQPKPSRPQPARKPAPVAETDSGWQKTLNLINLSLTMLFILVVLGGSAFLFLNVTKPNELKVPPLIGKTVAEARNILNERKLKLKVAQQVINDNYPPDTIFTTSPGSGTLVREGSSVAVAVSLGPKQFTVPDVRGLTESRAKEALEREGFKKVDVATREYNEEVSAGSVIRQEPKPGVEVDLSQRIQLVLSNGTSPEVPQDADPNQTELRTWTIPVSVPRRGRRDQVHVEVEFKDAGEARIVYDDYHWPGDKFEVPASGYGTSATVSILVDGKRISRRRLAPTE